MKRELINRGIRILVAICVAYIIAHVPIIWQLVIVLIVGSIVLIRHVLLGIADLYGK